MIPKKISRILEIKDSPQKVALGLGLGVFLGIMPGTGPIAALVLASLLRVNRISAVLGSLLVNTWVTIVTFFPAVKVGAFLLHLDWHLVYQNWKLFLQTFHWLNLLKLSVLDLILPVILGYIVISFILGVAAYLITLAILLTLRLKKELFKNLLISISAVLFILLLAEVIMRFAWQMGGWVERPIYRRSLNPYLRYELVPGAKSGNISINLDGFRGPEYSVKKPRDTFRIIMLGDSETLSFLLPAKDALAAQLESLLNQGAKKTRYEVLNFGVEGYGTLQELEMLETKGLKYNPDLIILNYCLNDPEPGEYYFNKTFFIRHSALVRYFSFRIKKGMIKRERKRLGIKTEIDNYYYYYQPKYFNTVKDAFLELADISKQRGNKLVVVIFPASSIMVNDFKENYPYRKLHQIIKSVKSENIKFIDLIDEFDRLNLTPQLVSINYKYDESHKNPFALGVSANYVYSILKKDKLIP